MDTDKTVSILFWQWDGFMQKGMENALRDLGIDFDIYFDIYYYPLDDWERDVTCICIPAMRIRKLRESL